MSAPDTDVEKQRDRHKPSLIGIKTVVVVAALGLIAFIFVTVINGADPSEPDGAGIDTVPAATAPLVDPEPAATGD